MTFLIIYIRRRINIKLNTKILISVVLQNRKLRRPCCRKPVLRWLVVYGANEDTAICWNKWLILQTILLFSTR